LARQLVPLSWGTEDQPVALQRIDSQERLACIRADGVCPVYGLGLPSRVELERALDRGAPVRKRDHERVTLEGRPRLPAALVRRVGHSIPLMGDLSPGALELFKLPRDGIGVGLRSGVCHRTLTRDAQSAHFFFSSFSRPASNSPRNGSEPCGRNRPHFPTRRSSCSIASTRITALLLTRRPEPWMTSLMSNSNTSLRPANVTVRKSV